MPYINAKQSCTKVRQQIFDNQNSDTPGCLAPYVRDTGFAAAGLY